MVIKLGSALMVDGQTRAIRHDWLNSVCADIKALRARGTETVIVSSGAIALARRQMGLLDGRPTLAEKQALAAIGQIGLYRAWQEALGQHGLVAAQFLLTPGDTENRRRHLNARSALEATLAMGAVPVINENDALSVTEQRFGDNDRLGARVAQMASASTLVLFSDIEGLFTADPRTHEDAAHIPVVARLDERIMDMGGAPPPGFSTGGMHTKLLAARIATRAGTEMIIADGRAPHPLQRLEDGERCTRFLPDIHAGTARKRWIAGVLSPEGSLTLDEGALAAIREGASLLPIGVRSVGGHFKRGDVVALLNHHGKAIGRGVAEYSSKDAQILMGHRLEEMDSLLGYHGRNALMDHNSIILDS
nr:glutamate 5-kinase [Formicincola oecophyllae]